ncbi:MAG: ThiF family adenylyltransferase [Planctomycetota bacterium]|jgi:molybdopterin/thiamine biosynthesis adenylyltransferase
MPGLTHHERLFRGGDIVDRLADVRVTVCGAGALGSQLTDSLTRQGFRNLRIIDHDRVEEHNVGTQVYGLCDVGVWKVEALRSHVFRMTEVDIDARRVELSERTVRKCLQESDLVVDAFDNSASRKLVQQHCHERGIPCLHIGLSAGYGEVIWNDNYRVPADVDGDVCDYALARNIVTLTASVAAEMLVRWLSTGRSEDVSLTLGDFAVRPLEKSEACSR